MQAPTIYRLTDPTGQPLEVDSDGGYQLQTSYGGILYVRGAAPDFLEWVAKHNEWQRKAGTIDRQVLVEQAVEWEKVPERIVLPEGREFGVIMDGERYTFRLTGEASAVRGAAIHDVHGSLIPDMPF